MTIQNKIVEAIRVSLADQSNIVDKALDQLNLIDQNDEGIDKYLQVIEHFVNHQSNLVGQAFAYLSQLSPKEKPPTCMILKDFDFLKDAFDPLKKDSTEPSSGSSSSSSSTSCSTPAAEEQPAPSPPATPVAPPTSPGQQRLPCPNAHNDLDGFCGDPFCLYCYPQRNDR